MDPSGAERPRNRRGEGERLRHEVLAAVNRLLDRWGSDEKLTMRAVAKEVGVSAPSIYLHFADKTELVWAALSDKYAQLADRMHEADLAALGDGPRARLAAQAHAYCAFAFENPGHYRLMYEVRQPAAEMERIGQHPSRRVGASFRTAVGRCADAGLSLALPPNQAAHTLWAALHGFVSLQHSLALPTPFEATTALADGLLDVLVARARDTRPAHSGDLRLEQYMNEIITDDAHELAGPDQVDDV